MPSNHRPKPKRIVTEGYLNQRLPRNNTIAMNQNYVTKVLENPRTPPCNRRVVIDYVNDHPEKFIPLADQTEDDMFNEWARKKNGIIKDGFLSKFKSKYV